MGLIVDTNLWVLSERGAKLDLARWRDHGAIYITAIIASELLVGVERANSAARRSKRAAFIEKILAGVPILDFTAAVARTHARLVAALPKQIHSIEHDALIAATAIHHGHTVLTMNEADFRVFEGLTVERFTLPAPA